MNLTLVDFYILSDHQQSNNKILKFNKYSNLTTNKRKFIESLAKGTKYLK